LKSGCVGFNADNTAEGNEDEGTVGTCDLGTREGNASSSLRSRLDERGAVALLSALSDPAPPQAVRGRI
jgi:hypothetical protein